MTLVDKFIWRGVAQVHWLSAVANPLAPTRLELDAGVDLTPAVFGVSGFSLEPDMHNLPSLLSDFVGQSVGVRRSQNNSLTLYESKTTTTMRDALAEGTVGNLLLVPYGDVAGRRCEVWPAQVAALLPGWGEEVARFRALFAITSDPTRDALMPAAA